MPILCDESELIIRRKADSRLRVEKELIDASLLHVCNEAITFVPKPPTDLTVVTNEGAGEITISATASVTANIVSYNAYVDSSLVAIGISEETLIAGYTFTGLQGSTEYDFQFTAVDDVLLESNLSPALTVTLADAFAEPAFYNAITDGGFGIANHPTDIWRLGSWNYDPVNGLFYGAYLLKNGSQSGDVLTYNPVTKAWSNLPNNFPVHQTATWIEGIYNRRIYQGAGFTLKDLDYYNLDDASQGQVASVANNYSAGDVAIDVNNGVAIMLGGLFGSTGVASSFKRDVQIVNLDTGAITAKSLSPFSWYSGINSIFDQNTGLLYTGGGDSRAGSGFAGATAFYQYDYVSDVWTARANLPVHTNSGRIIQVDSDIILYFHNDGTPGSTTGTSVYEYTISTNTWSPTPIASYTSGVRLEELAIGSLGEVWLFGGRDDNTGLDVGRVILFDWQGVAPSP